MRDGNSKKIKPSWPKSLVKKWLNIHSNDGDFHADEITHEGWNTNVAESEPHTVKKSKRRNRDRDRRNKIELDPPQTREVQDCRIFAATWNVGGKSPPSYLNLKEWLNTSPPADIYVLGFQEIVPLNAGNVLGTEDDGPARKWQALIRKTLNSFPICQNDGENDCSFSQRSSGYYCPYDDDGDLHHSHSFSTGDSDRYIGRSRYSLVASKQMVGLLLMVWTKSDFRDAVQNLNVSCVGRGLMGYLGNKGAISISMTLQKTSFCFVCSHLTSGEKDGDELRRNSDVMEILRKTRFPQTILDHDRIIWLGDLNYRISLSYRCAKALVEMRNWRALLENDQLRTEQRNGRVFEGWSEGKIYFPPTYKYSDNSDRYAGEDLRPKEKRRTPAWCDRILWRGDGLRQLSYVRGESRFSDHRPVWGLFVAEVEPVDYGHAKKSASYLSSRVEAEEILESYAY